MRRAASSPRPYSVVLLDEIEKAHHDVFNVLLQILEDGRLTDSHGRTVNFKNTIVIMTSNIGSTYLLDGIGKSGGISEGVRRQVMDDLKQSFRPEFMNRIDEVVLFKPLDHAEIAKIVDLLMSDFMKRLGERGMKLKLSEKARDFIVKEGYDPVYGARPLKRFIQREIETPIARGIISGDYSDGSLVSVDFGDGRLVCR
jgi:ATP-dependent Clp protease ATP-binding subunit ClpB